ncbi:MAG: S28 family serine protease [Kofleriaceae bacterium]
MRTCWLVVLVAACGDNGIPNEPAPRPPIPATCDEAALPATLAGIDGVTRAVETECGDYVTGPARCFEIGFDQPVDHQRPAKRFTQRVFLIHRGCDNPNLVADWGYSQDLFYDDELSALYQTNSLWIEHRFQGESLPSPTDWDWTQLTIENGATDMHRVIEAFRTHYSSRFVSTGASKGGITATYHKFLFSDDVEGSIPYVAPASRARVDPEYQANLDTALPMPCAQRVRDAQVAALTTRRTMMLGHLTGEVAPGFEPLYLEFIAGSFDWAFWQYYGMAYCQNVPTTTTADTTFWQFFASFSGLMPEADQPRRDDQLSNGALSYEWLTEQGFALQRGAHVASLIVEPEAVATMEDNFRTQFPGVALLDYDGSLTAATRTWVRDEAEDLLLIYGQYDPWSGGAMEAPVKTSAARFYVPNATHGAQISELAFGDREAALAHASRMFGREPVAAKPGAHRTVAHDYVRRHELAAMKRAFGLPR